MIENGKILNLDCGDSDSGYRDVGSKTTRHKQIYEYVASCDHITGDLRGRLIISGK